MYERAHVKGMTVSLLAAIPSAFGLACCVQTLRETGGTIDAMAVSKGFEQLWNADFGLESGIVACGLVTVFSLFAYGIFYINKDFSKE